MTKTVIWRDARSLPAVVGGGPILKHGRAGLPSLRA
jgi:hypothetical protein